VPVEENAVRLAAYEAGTIDYVGHAVEEQGAEGREILESKYERDVRSGAAGRENQLSGEKAKPEQVSVKMMK
jgi:hypothetical protein